MEHKLKTSEEQVKDKEQEIQDSRRRNGARFRANRGVVNELKRQLQETKETKDREIEELKWSPIEIRYDEEVEESTLKHKVD